MVVARLLDAFQHLLNDWVSSRSHPSSMKVLVHHPDMVEVQKNRQ